MTLYAKKVSFNESVYGFQLALSYFKLLIYNTFLFRVLKSFNIKKRYI